MTEKLKAYWADDDQKYITDSIPRLIKYIDVEVLLQSQV